MKRSATLAFLLLLASLFLHAKDDRLERPGRIHLDREGERWAERTLKKMSLEEKVGQMLQITRAWPASPISRARITNSFAIPFADTTSDLSF